MRISILCEDQQQAAFVRRVLGFLGHDKRTLVVLTMPPGQGAGSQYVLAKYVQELGVLRSKNHQNLALLVVIDGDNVGMNARVQELDDACRRQKVSPRDKSDKVAFFIPTRNIETWLAYLGGTQVDEQNNYRKLPLPSQCGQYAKTWVEICRGQKKLSYPPPPSLPAACAEYRQRLSQ